LRKFTFAKLNLVLVQGGNRTDSAEIHEDSGVIWPRDRREDWVQATDLVE